MQRRLLACFCVVTVWWSAAAVGTAASYVWLEGEKPAEAQGEPTLSGWGNADFLSQGAWLSYSIPDKEIEAKVPESGLAIRYPFELDEAGKYEVWLRIGFEFVRSDFEWQIDGGERHTVTPDDLTTDLMEIATWCEVAWLHAGDVELVPGRHVLEIRLPRRKDDEGKWKRILFAFDAACLSREPFHPNGKYRPDQDWRTDRDRAAAEHVFRLPPPKGAAERVELPLAGDWEICRDDEQYPKDVDKPIPRLPETTYFTAIQVPGDKNTLRPDLVFAHRLWYRTRVEVPTEYSGRSFFLVFPQNNLNTTVYVNGRLCGFDKNPFARVQIDITPAIKPGINEVWVGIRDAWYGYSTNPNDPMKLRRVFNRPIKFFSEGFQDLAYPIWNHPQSGILMTPKLIAAGPVYAEDVFCKPSVAKKSLGLEVTLKNPASESASGTLLCEVIDDDGTVAKRFAPVEFELKPGAEKLLDFTESWENPKLWWPDDPHLYRLRATVRLNDRPVDVSETTFGFREWSWQGKDFKLNGIVWHGWADCFRASSPEEWIAFYRQTNQRMMRFWGASWQGLPPEEALTFFDKHGVVVRRSGILDGERIGYNAVEHDPDLVALYDSPIKMQLMKNWKDQLLAQIRGERNHPSVMIWSIENEWLYINCINLHRKYMDLFEEAVYEVAEAAMALDPTRPVMTDGGGAGAAQKMPVHGDHYVFKGYTAYPDLAYEANPTAGGRERWVWDQKRPRFIGEDFFANGINPFDYSYFGGEETFQGKAQSHRAAGIIYRMLTEGYRWAGYGAWHFWMGQHEAEDQYNSNAPRAVFCRQWDWTFGAGQTVRRTFRIFNDTRFDDPIRFACELTIDGKTIAKGEREYRVPPGASETVELAFRMPQTNARVEGTLVLRLTVGGEEVFRDEKAVSVLPDAAKVHPQWPAELKKEDLLVYDPHGSVAAFLDEADIAYTKLDDLEALPESGKVLVVGKDAIDAMSTDSTRFQAWASTGRAVVVLEQREPLRYQALPSDMTPDDNEGRTAFIEDVSHPIFRDLAQKDFFTWAGDHVVYRKAYTKPTRGAKSLVQCDLRLARTALAEVPCGRGVMLLSQLVIGEKLDRSAAARQLLVNLLSYGANYRLEYHPVLACTRGMDALLRRELDAIKVKYDPVDDPVAALAGKGPRIAIVPAVPENLQALVGAEDALVDFYADGGYLFLHGLTPEGLDAYNRLTGVDHLIRPFWRERVTMAMPRHPLCAGLTLADVVMRSGERIFGWTRDEYVADNVFSYVVDVDDVLSFARFANDFERNMVNGMVSADAWKYIVNVPVPEDGGPVEFEMELPKPRTIDRMEWIGNTFYYPVTKAALIFDGDEEHAFVFETEPNNEPQEFVIDPPRTGKHVLLRLLEWEIVPEKHAVTGLDNIKLFAKRDDDFRRRVHPMLNVGGLVEYKQGPGGIVLCNVKFEQSEAVPENADKKRKILATLLRNLKAPFAEGKTVIAGAPMRYEPIDIAKHCNQYRDAQGWFGDKQYTFADLPVGDQRFAGVPFHIYDFPTSPVPTCIMLGGKGVPGNLPDAVRGITIARKADAVFFLHTARMDHRRSPRDLAEDKRYVMARYVVHYADGQTASIDLEAEIDIDDYHPEQLQPIPGAQLAWVKPYPDGKRTAVAYCKQWNNPRPEVEISSVDFEYGPDRRGVPALLAITAAKVE